MSGAGGERVLVTGVTGFVAGHCAKHLLDRGYSVRGTVRSLADPATETLEKALAPSAGGRLELVEADLTDDKGWAAAVAGCAYVQHVASPFPASIPEHVDDLLAAAVDGTREVLTACARDGGVRRVVLTSSAAAVIFGHATRSDQRLDETVWSNPDGCDAYQKSKTLAERAAWDLVEALPPEQRFDLVAVNPGMVIGPLLTPRVNTTMEVLGRLLRREVPASPRMAFAVTDVRDVAAAHRLAMESPAAPGNRYLCAGENLWMRDIARVLATRYAKVPTGQLPDFVVRAAGLFDPAVRLAATYLGPLERTTSNKAFRELGWTRRDPAATILDAAESLIAFGLAPDRRKVRA
ncbi:SDR family oxidoreductase [Streptomyces sp. CA2R106]|uniref:SDR family oxidoreductase n=1 Tax=Streptomyces sp. CA2R106 TaxID=3120153 RepID=UPI00300A0627